MISINLFKKVFIISSENNHLISSSLSILKASFAPISISISWFCKARYCLSSSAVTWLWSIPMKSGTFISSPSFRSLSNLPISSFSHLYWLLRSLTGFILTNAHLYLSYFNRFSPISLAKGCTGPAPISKTVILLLCSGSNHLMKASFYRSALSSIQSISCFRFTFGRTGLPHCVQWGTDTDSPFSWSSLNLWAKQLKQQKSVTSKAFNLQAWFALPIK